MSARDKVRSFAEAREHDHVPIRDGLTYGDAREVCATFAGLERDRRERIATAAFQATIAGGWTFDSDGKRAERAVSMADHLIHELDKEQP